jgi:RHS repeat-associated protein
VEFAVLARRLVTVLVLPFLASLAGSGRAAAQSGCNQISPPCPPDEAPSISFDQRNQTVTTSTITVTLWMYDDHQLDGSTLQMPAAFSIPGALGNEAYATGTLTLQPGANTFTAYVCDVPFNSPGSAQCAADTVIYTYTPPPPPPAHAAAVISLAPHNGDNRDVSRCIAGCFELTTSYSTPAYTSLDVPRSLTLFYSAAQVLPSVTFQVDATESAQTAPTTLSLLLRRNQAYQGFDYLTGSPTEIFFQGANGTSRLAGRFSMGTAGTGAELDTVVVRARWADNTVIDTTAPIRILRVRETSSPYGYGWSIAGLAKLTFQTDGIVLTTGDGSGEFFANCTTSCATYVSPAGDFTTMAYYDSASVRWYKRTWVNGTTARFDNTGRLVVVRDRYGNQNAFAYNGAGALYTITDPAGLVTTLSYDGNGKLSSIRDPGGRTTTVKIDVSSNLFEIDDPDGVKAMQITYDGSHVLQSVTDRRGGLWSYQYDWAGKVDTIRGPTITANGQSVRQRATLRAEERLALVDPAGGTGTSANPAAQRVPGSLKAKLTAPNGDSTVYLVNRFGQATRHESRGPMNQWTFETATYSDQGLPISTTNVKGASTQYTWFGTELLKQVDVTTGSELDIDYETAYHQPTLEGIDGATLFTNYYGTLGRLDSTKAGSSVTRYTYDSRGRVLTTTDPQGHQRSASYQSTGFQNTATLTGPSPNGGTVTDSFTYDAFGRLGTLRDGIGRHVAISYDTLNRTTRASGPLSSAVTNTFGDITHQRSVTDPKGQVYTYFENPLGWVDSLAEPGDAAGHLQGYAYDSLGNVITVTNRRAQQIHYTYDAQSRLLQVVSSPDTITQSYDGSYQWTVIKDAESLDTLKYDANGRLTGAVSMRGTSRYVLTPTYTAAGQRSAMTVNGTVGGSNWSRSIVYGYDALLRPNFFQDMSGRATSVSYNKDQLDSVRALPVKSGSNGVKEQFVYNAAHNLQQQAWVPGPDLTVGRHYAYDGLGRITAITRGQPHQENPQVLQDQTIRSLAYDSLGRLTLYVDEHQWEEYGQYVCPDPNDLFSCYYEIISHDDTLRQDSYTYDAAGNRTDHSAVVGTGNRLTTFDGYTMTYDADGNLVKKTKAGFSDTLTWNAFGELVAVTLNGVTTTFGYDGLGRRVRKTVGSTTTRYLWDGDDLLMELDGSGNPLREYTYLPGVDNPLSVRRSSDGKPLYYATALPGHVVALMDTLSNVTNSYDLTPWGDSLIVTEQVPQPLRFGAREYDDATGLYYNRARYYDPKLGRFVSEDPIGLSGGLNPYVYTDDNPVGARDPSGLDPCTNKGLETQSIQPATSPYDGASGTMYTCVDPVSGAVIVLYFVPNPVSTNSIPDRIAAQRNLEAIERALGYDHAYILVASGAGYGAIARGIAPDQSISCSGDAASFAVQFAVDALSIAAGYKELEEAAIAGKLAIAAAGSGMGRIAFMDATQAASFGGIALWGSSGGFDAFGDGGHMDDPAADLKDLIPFHGAGEAYGAYRSCLNAQVLATP